MKNEEAELYSIFSKMKKMRFMGMLLGTSILLSVCTAKSDVHTKKRKKATQSRLRPSQRPRKALTAKLNFMTLI